MALSVIQRKAERARAGERRQAVMARIHLDEAKRLVGREELLEALKVSEKIESPEESADTAAGFEFMPRPSRQPTRPRVSKTCVPSQSFCNSAAVILEARRRRPFPRGASTANGWAA